MPTASSFKFELYVHHPPKVQRLLRDRVEKSGDFSTLQTLHIGDDLSQYGKQIKTILCPADLETVWSCYTQRTPTATWQGPLVHFLFAYRDADKQFFYSTDQYVPPFEEGLICYCWLNLWGPRLIIGLKILRIDQGNKELEIAYVEGGLYRGTQILSFSADGEQSRIEHVSYFKSASRLMDATLYPFFHNWTVGEHHEKMAAELTK
ncbi:MAG: hypothetical protein AAF587_14770 [Bacteroidota bacterium]